MSEVGPRGDDEWRKADERRDAISQATFRRVLDSRPEEHDRIWDEHDRDVQALNRVTRVRCAVPFRLSIVRVMPRRVNGPSGRPRAAASRSSAASGDSGSDDPPGHQLALLAELDDGDRDACADCGRRWSWLVHRDPADPARCDSCTEAAA